MKIAVIVAALAYVSAADVTIMSPDSRMSPKFRGQTAIASRNSLKAVTGPDTDAVVMSRASGVVASNQESSAVLSKQVLGATSTDDKDTSVMSRGAVAVDCPDKSGDLGNLVKAAMRLGRQQAMHEQAIQARMPQGDLAFTGTRDILRQPSAVVNKNFVLNDNQMTITRSQFTPTKNDQILMRDNAKVATGLASGSSIVYIPSSMKRSEAYEQAIQASRPRVVSFTGTRDILRQPSAVVNKNVVLSDNQMTITRSQFSPTMNDQVTMSGDAKVADALATGSSILYMPASAIKEDYDEQAIQARDPHYLTFTGTRDTLRQSSGVVNKNFVLDNNQIAISRSQFSPTSNDQVTMQDNAKVADILVPGSSILVGRPQA